MNLEDILAELRSQRARIDQAISVLQGSAGYSAPRRGRPPKSQAAPTLGQTRRRTMTQAARKRISDAMKRRWAKWKGKSAPKKKSAARPAVSAAARKKLSNLMKARWAAKKKKPA